MKGSQAIDLSFDSSEELDSLSDTNSTPPLQHAEVVRIATTEDIYLEFDLPILRQDNCQHESTSFGCQYPDMQFTLGFKSGWGKKAIQINQSKLKRAKLFFDDSQGEDKEQYSMNLMGEKVQFNDVGVNWDNMGADHFSMPCFKTVGKGIQIKVSSEAKEKAQQMFKGISSMQKSTKVKQTNKIMSQSLIKTIGLSQKQARETVVEEAVMEQIASVRRMCVGVSRKRNDENERVTLGRTYSFLRFDELPIHFEDEPALSERLKTSTVAISQITFKHSKLSCMAISCILCKLSIECQKMSALGLFELMVKYLAKKRPLEELFIRLWQEVMFKLIKYEIYWPTIANKVCHPTNVIVEMNKKLLRYQQLEEGSAIKQVFFRDQIGRKITLIVKSKLPNLRLEGLFLKLSDGWSSLWAFIEPHNLLFPYLQDDRKVRVGTKLCLCCWNVHPICNILFFCSQATSEDKSIILHQNARLGFSEQQFYRPLSKCRDKGGSIPLVQGVIVRMFSGKYKSKKHLSALSSQYIEILTVEGITCHIKFVMHEQSSLVQHFRLYHSYQFYKLKINEAKMLAFIMKQSKFQQSPASKPKQTNKHSQRLLKLLQQRHLNSQKAIELAQVGKAYDFINRQGCLLTKEGTKRRMVVLNEAQEDALMLYQQFILVGKSTESLTFSRHPLSSRLRRIPKIYDQLQ